MRPRYNTDNLANLTTEKNHVSIHTVCSITLPNTVRACGMHSLREALLGIIVFCPFFNLFIETAM